MNTFTNAHTRRAARLLTLFALSGIGIASLIHHSVKTRIAAAQNRAEAALYRDIVPAVETLPPAQPLQLGAHPVTYQHTAATHFIRATTRKGYSGDITLLIAIADDNRTLRGVRVLSHKETPGLGDKIEPHISPWIHGFAGKTLENTRFAVKQDGGDFDAFSGATITPRAVVTLTGDILNAWQQENPALP